MPFWGDLVLITKQGNGWYLWHFQTKGSKLSYWNVSRIRRDLSLFEIPCAVSLHKRRQFLPMALSVGWIDRYPFPLKPHTATLYIGVGVSWYIAGLMAGIHLIKCTSSSSRWGTGILKECRIEMGHMQNVEALVHESHWGIHILSPKRIKWDLRSRWLESTQP